jgi:hypothetical protein
MPSPQHISLDSSQREFFRILARRMRDVGYFGIAISIMAIVLNLIDFSLQLSAGGRIDDTMRYLYSYIGGVRLIDWSRVFLVMVEAPIGIFIGWHLVQGARCFAALYGDDTPSAESLLGGLWQVKKIVDINYLKILLLVGFIWLIVLFN